MTVSIRVYAWQGGAQLGAPSFIEYRYTGLLTILTMLISTRFPPRCEKLRRSPKKVGGMDSSHDHVFLSRRFPSPMLRIGVSWAGEHDRVGFCAKRFGNSLLAIER